jgi:hypothetical protein
LAEKKAILGLELEFDNITVISDNSTELTILGKKYLVEPDNIEQEIIKANFNPQNIEGTRTRIESIPLHQIEKFIIAGSENNNLTAASYGLYAFMLHSLATLENFSELLEKIKPNNNYRSILENTRSLLDHTPLNILPLFSFALATCEFQGETNYKLPKDPEYATSLYEYAAKHTISLILKQNLKEASNVINCLKMVFTNKHLSINNIEKLQNSLPKTIKNFEANPSPYFPSVTELSGNDHEIAPLLTNILNSYFVNQAKTFSTKNNPTLTLWLLSKITPDKRTLETISLTTSQLNEANTETEKAILNPAVSQYLNELSSLNINFRDFYINFIQKLATYLLKNNQPDRLQLLLGVLASINPDPHIINDRIRLDLANHYIRRGNKELGLAIYNRLQGGLPFWENSKWAIIMFWHKNNVLFLAIVLIPTFLLIATIGLIIKNSNINKQLNEQYRFKGFDCDDETSTDDENNNDRPLFVKKGLSQHLTPIAQEYAHLIKLFSIEADSDVALIKSAYRAKIKSLHPDINTKNKTGKEVQEIMKIKQAYERLLEIIKSELISKEEISLIKKTENLESQP